jgi:hypothetical protein|tara:strand:- start:408 stop:596 length:189 start_codon:yes stop_codon:yes gene_type:complete
MHLEGFPPHKSHSLPGSRFAKPPQEPDMGFLPKKIPTDIAVTIKSKTKNVIKPVSIFLFYYF